MSSEDYYIYEEEEEVAYSSYHGIDLPLNISEGSHREQSKGKKSKGDRMKKITKQEKGVKEGRGKKNGSGGKGAVPVTGRPTNLHEEKVHMEENRSYTHIIYHYARFLIFFKLLPEAAPLPLDLPPAHCALLPLWQRALAADPFPLPHHPALFLLHPASLHSILLFLREKFARIAYSSEEMKSLFLIFLESKQLLTQPILDYLNDYWNDIVFLVNHPQDGAADI